MARRRRPRMVGTLLEAGGLDPTVINGGIINAYGTNARMGDGDWMVVEADETDGTFLKLPADIAVVTNIDPEHLDHYGSFDKVRDAFRAVRRERAVLRLRRDVPRPSRGAGAGLARSRTARSSPMARTRRPMCASSTSRSMAAGTASTSRSAIARPALSEVIGDLMLPMPGRHNVSNATAAIAVAHELGIGAEAIRAGLAVFRRRQAALHPYRHVERRRDLRRLRPPSGRDHGGAEGGARIGNRPRHRDQAAASLHAPA